MRRTLATLDKVIDEIKELKTQRQAATDFLQDLDSTACIREAAAVVAPFFGDSGPLAAGNFQFDGRNVVLLWSPAPSHTAEEVSVIAGKLGTVSPAQKPGTLTIVRAASGALATAKAE